MIVAEVQNAAFGVQSRKDQALTPQNAISAKTRFQCIEMSHAVKQRQDLCLPADRRCYGHHCVVEIVGFAAEKYKIEGLIQRIRRDRRRYWQRHVAQPTRSEE